MMPPTLPRLHTKRISVNAHQSLCCKPPGKLHQASNAHSTAPSALLAPAARSANRALLSCDTKMPGAASLQHTVPNRNFVAQHVPKGLSPTAYPLPTAAPQQATAIIATILHVSVVWKTIFMAVIAEHMERCCFYSELPKPSTNRNLFECHHSCFANPDTYSSSVQAGMTCVTPWPRFDQHHQPTKHQQQEPAQPVGIHPP